jgi:hypothetical protein
MNAETQRSRGGTAILFWKRVFLAWILGCICGFPAPLFSAEPGKSEVPEKPVETVAEKVEQVEFQTTPPEGLKGPTTVYFTVFVADISEINAAGQSFTVNLFLRLRWNDPRLANPEGAVREIPLEKMWNPRILLVNQKTRVKKGLPDVVQVHPDGTVLYHQRYTGILSQRLKLVDFPRDTHSFNVQFLAVGHNADELTFEPDRLRNIRGGSMAKELSLPDWEILTYETRADPYKPVDEINAAAFAFRFEAQRYIGYYLWQMVLPLVVVVIMSWAAFWVGREHVGVRLAVASSSVLTLIAQRFVLASLLPRLPYMTRMDYFTVGSTLLVLLALIAVSATGFLFAHRHESHARTIDHWARGAFPAAFLLLVSWFMVG